MTTVHLYLSLVGSFDAVKVAGLPPRRSFRCVVPFFG